MIIENETANKADESASKEGGDNMTQSTTIEKVSHWCDLVNYVNYVNYVNQHQIVFVCFV